MWVGGDGFGQSRREKAQEACIKRVYKEKCKIQHARRQERKESRLEIT